jgi:uncharacterized protein (DUF2132 family)
VIRPQARNPLHGISLEQILTSLVEHVGWEALGAQVRIRRFRDDPSIPSSLRLLRKTPWARNKVESLYLYVLREQARQARSESQTARGSSSHASSMAFRSVQASPPSTRGRGCGARGAPPRG